MRWLGLGLSVMGLLLSSGTTEAFEGTLKWRLVQVDRTAMAKVTGDGSDAAKVFAVPYEKLMSMHGDAKVIDATVSVKGSKMRADTTARDGKGYFIVDLDTGVTSVVMPAEKKVLVVTREDVQGMETRVASARAMFEKQLEHADPERRAKMEEFLKQAPDPESVEVVAVDKEQVLYGMKTSAYEVRGAPQQSIVGWVTSDRPEVLELFKKIEKTRSQLDTRGAQPPKRALTKEGLPVRVQILDAKQYTVEDLVEVEEKPLPDDLFAVPADYTTTNPREIAERAAPAKKPN